jgi:Flp pilus assembly pilin Flp
MDTVIRHIKRFLTSDDGPTPTEYAVILALLVIAGLGAIALLGEKMHTAFLSAGADSTGK